MTAFDNAKTTLYEPSCARKRPAWREPSGRRLGPRFSEGLRFCRELSFLTVQTVAVAMVLRWGWSLSVLSGTQAAAATTSVDPPKPDSPPAAPNAPADGAGPVPVRVGTEPVASPIAPTAAAPPNPIHPHPKSRRMRQPSGLVRRRSSSGSTPRPWRRPQ